MPTSRAAGTVALAASRSEDVPGQAAPGLPSPRCRLAGQMVRPGGSWWSWTDPLLKGGCMQEGCPPPAAPTWPWGDKEGPGLAPVTGKAPPHQSPRVSGGRGRASGEYTGGDWCQQGRGLSLSRGGTGRDSATSASSRRPQPPVALGTEPSLPGCAQRLCLRVRLY